MSSQVKALTAGKALQILQGFLICTHGLSEKEVSIAALVCNKLGGKLAEHITENVTCLVARKAGSKEYQFAMKHSIPVVTADWLSDCYKQRTQGAIIPFKNYILRPFSGLVICCTQISPEERHRMLQLVEANGGKCTFDLVKNSCTHLVAKEPTGDKYLFAKSWGNIHIVKMEWIEECVKQKKWVQEVRYMVLPLKAKISKSGSSNLDNLLQASQQRNMDGTKVGDGRNGGTGAGSSSGQRLIITRTTNIISCLDSMLLNSISSASSSSSSSSSLLSLSSTHGLRDFLPNPVQPAAGDIGRIKPSVFRGDLFFLAGFESEVLNYITRLILAGGGHISMVYTAKVTKVLFGAGTHSNFHTEARRHSCTLAHVNIVWLLEKLYSTKTLAMIGLEIMGKEMNLPQCHFSGVDLSSVKTISDVSDLIRRCFLLHGTELDPAVGSVSHRGVSGTAAGDSVPNGTSTSTSTTGETKTDEDIEDAAVKSSSAAAATKPGTDAAQVVSQLFASSRQSHQDKISGYGSGGGASSSSSSRNASRYGDAACCVVVDDSQQHDMVLSAYASRQRQLNPEISAPSRKSGWGSKFSSGYGLKFDHDDNDKNNKTDQSNENQEPITMNGTADNNILSPNGVTDCRLDDDVTYQIPQPPLPSSKLALIKRRVGPSVVDVRIDTDTVELDLEHPPTYSRKRTKLSARGNRWNSGNSSGHKNNNSGGSSGNNSINSGGGGRNALSAEDSQAVTYSDSPLPAEGQ